MAAHDNRPCRTSQTTCGLVAMLLLGGSLGCSGDDDTPGAPSATSTSGTGGAAGTGGSGGTAGSGGSGGGPVEITLTTLKGFPDLWGEGADQISGGRGSDGVKFFVTELDDVDDGPTHVPATATVEEHYTGTLREALQLEQRRHVIPRVAGRIVLQSSLNISGATRGHLTYHGHLAPSGGLAVTHDNLVFRDSQNVVFRFLRLRFGNNASLSIDDTLTTRRVSQLAVDHGSFAWGGDETFSVGTAPNETFPDIIVQRCIIGQSMDGHNTGTLIGWTDEGDDAHGVVTWHDNVYVGVTHRTPNFAGDTEMYGRIYNNVAYDWQWRLTNVIGAATVDVAYNYYKMGPASPNVPAANYHQYQDLQGSRPYPPSIFTEGNLMPGVMDDPDGDNRTLWSYFGESTALPDELFRADRLPVDPSVGYQPTTAQEAYDRNVVAKEAGANRTTDADGHPVLGLDSVDDHYLTAIANGTDPRTADADWQHPEVTAGTPYADADWNGIADDFEQAHGITSSADVIPRYDFGDFVVVNDAGYDAFEIYSAWVAGDFHRLAE